jgi:hypothetical protein
MTVWLRFVLVAQGGRNRADAVRLPSEGSTRLEGSSDYGPAMLQIFVFSVSDVGSEVKSELPWIISGRLRLRGWLQLTSLDNDEQHSSVAITNPTKVPQLMSLTDSQ